jgi:F-type H+-transporting ATPase subunit b
VTRASGVRRIALTLSALVTIWSVWAWAQSPSPVPDPKHGHDLGGRSRAAPPASVRPHEMMAPQDAIRSGAEPAQREEEHDESEAPAPINWFELGAKPPPFIAMWVNFAILIGAYYVLGKRPIAAALIARRETIAREIDEARRMKLEAEGRAKMYQAKLERLEEEVRTAREALLQAGEAESERIVREAEAKAERMRRDAQFVVEQEIKQIRIELWREALDAAVSAAGELLTQRVTPPDQERLAEEHLAALAAIPPAATSGETGVAP